MIEDLTLAAIESEDCRLKLLFRQCPITQNSVKERVRPEGGAEGGVAAVSVSYQTATDFCMDYFAVSR